MNEKQKAKWERTRAKGMWRFILVTGVLLWGGLMIVARSAFDFFFNRSGFLENLSITVPIFLVAGFVFGLAMWLVGEHNYRKTSDVGPK